MHMIDYLGFHRFQEDQNPLLDPGLQDLDNHRLPVGLGHLRKTDAEAHLDLARRTKPRHSSVPFLPRQTIRSWERGDRETGENVVGEQRETLNVVKGMDCHLALGSQVSQGSQDLPQAPELLLPLEALVVLGGQLLHDQEGLHIDYLSVLGSLAFQETTPHRSLLSVLENLLVLGYLALRGYLDVFLYLEIQRVLAGQLHQHLLDLLEVQEARIPLTQHSQLVLVYLKNLVDPGNHETQGVHLHQVCQGVPGLLSLPLSQECCRNMSLLFVLEGLEIPFDL
ncbi:hypothetical protein F7725_011527 [Dissostichus mawsoni]|uniref:Uncharacterized protein n=1 Tax=Dissostichus mawsoni TaxID=36200 RepID=A0A7J5Z9H3_DISMA|nr:hypothetical protein F7725_011527 [Dissostichus mawsoni]